MARYHRHFNVRGRGYSKRPAYMPYSMIGGAFYGMERLEDWRLRGRWYEDYYRNTGYRPRYYNAFKRKRIKG